MSGHTAVRVTLMALAALVGSVAEGEPKRLNNLVTEYVNSDTFPLSGTATEITLPRDNWIYVRAEARVAEGGSAEFAWDSDAVAVRLDANAPSAEGMRFLRAGSHTLRVRGVGTVSPSKLVVRAVPELQYTPFPGGPYIAAQGPRDWAFMQAYILPNINTILGDPKDEHIDEWIARGGKWVAYGHVPKDEGLNVDKAYEYWAQNAGVQDPRLSGVIADEFNGRQNPLYPVWTEALRRLGQTPAFDGDAFYGYCGGPGMYSRPQARELVRTVLEIHSYMAWERYLHEMPTLEQAKAFLDSHLGEEMKRWRATFPGCQDRLVMVAPIFTSGFGINVQPEVDFKAWIDMQIQYYATNPAFDGLFGLQYWSAAYADEELLRWAYRLFRHYGIEGNTELLSKQYGYRYALDHIVNPDFASGLDGWQVEPAASDSVSTQYIERYANLEGRYWLRANTPDEPAGNTMLWTKRHAERANRVSQEVRNLEPGKLYSVKMIAADYGDIVRGVSQEKQLAASLRVQGAEVVPEKSYQVAANSGPVGVIQGFPFGGDKPAWFTHYRVVFRAAGPTARLTISDWMADDTPGGDEGQEIVYNFVELQPYYAE